MNELEKTYLIKEAPENLASCPSKEIIDIYIPKENSHPKMRIRKNGDQYEITKKEAIVDGDYSNFLEETIKLTEQEFNCLSQLDGLKLRKLRYKYQYRDRIAEIDVFQDALHGLIVVDFEFETLEEKDNFLMPDFCVADVTQDDFIAGGMLCGKSYSDVEKELIKYNYKNIN